MAEKFGCTKCEEYSYALRRCTLGLVNPKTKKDTESTATMMGGDTVCEHNKWYETVKNIKGFI